MPEEVVARGSNPALEKATASLRRSGIDARVAKGVVVVPREHASRAREQLRGASTPSGRLRLVTGREAAYEHCHRCFSYHGPGATFCKACGAYVRP